MAQTTHLQRTEGVRRQTAAVAARIVAITAETPTVRRFQLKPLVLSTTITASSADSAAADDAPPSLEHGPSRPSHLGDAEAAVPFDFRPGQWLDCYLPGVEVVGGYSICSGRRQYEREGVVELAVKYSAHAPALWMHTKARVGDVIHMRVGGEFEMDEDTATQKKLLFVAGGVGINPLISMIREWHDAGHSSTLPGRRAVLLYSAKDQSELAFRQEIQAIAEKDSQCSVKYFLTKEETNTAGMEKGRIGLPHLRHAITSLLDAGGSSPSDSMASLEAYICGPKGMIDECVASLKTIGLQQRQIHYESWW